MFSLFVCYVDFPRVLCFVLSFFYGCGCLVCFSVLFGACLLMVCLVVSVDVACCLFVCV